MLNRPMEWGILIQRAMNARFVIIRGILAQDPAQVRLPEHDQVVETFPADRTDQSLDVSILPWAARPGRERACGSAIRCSYAVTTEAQRYAFNSDNVTGP